MADPFQPRFVDLVRNFTSTQGTGDFVLGPAVNGYTSFTAALQPGDSFYYSAIGVDKPNEREVGRGTLLANGNISRSPISGGLTNFSSGTKSVALIAAAEWFSKVEQGSGASGGSTAVAATRSALAATPPSAGVALLTEAGRAGLFAWDPADLSDLVAADSAGGIYVPPGSDATGASGAWVRQYDGPIMFDWFGAVPGDYQDGPSADCLAAWSALQSFLVATRRNAVLGAMAGAPQILFPGAQYYFSDSISLKVTARLTGMGSGQGGSGWPTTLRFAADKAGIIVNERYTNGDAQQSPTTTSAAGAIIEGFNLVADGGMPSGTLTDDLLKSGIRLRARAVIRDCRISNFRGAGICISAAVGDGSNPYHGNCNGWRVDTVRIEGCRTGGLFVSGGDANAGVATLVDATACGRFGIHDGAFLGNTYIGCHADGNGLMSNTGLSQTGTVYRSGRNYYLRLGVATATAQSTEPGTDPSVWADMGPAAAASANFPAWSASGNYVAAGAYGHTGSANSCAFIGCYYETGQAPPQIGAAATVYNGFMGAGAADGGTHLTGSAAGLMSQRPLIQSANFADGSFASSVLGGNMSGTATGFLDLLSWGSSSATPSNPGSASSLAQEKATGDVAWMPGGAGIAGYPKPFRLTGPTTAMTYGRVGADNRFITEILNLALGDGNSARVITTGTGAPTSGYHAAGELVIHNAPSLGSSPVGWRCITSGTPGTWEAFLGHGGTGLVYTKGSDNNGVAGPATAIAYDPPTSKGQLYCHDFTAGQYRGLQLQSSGLTVEIGLSWPPALIATFDSAGMNLAGGKTLKVNGTQVISARESGWAADTGTAKKGANATYSGTAEATYTQATVQALMDSVRDATQTVKALKDALLAHGLIGA